MLSSRFLSLGTSKVVRRTIQPARLSNTKSVAKLEKPTKLVKRNYEKKSYGYAKKSGAPEAKPFEKKPFPRKAASGGSQSEPTKASLSSEIKALNAMGEYKKAKEVWQEARSKSLVVDEFAYATILSTLRHLEDYDGALAMYSNEILPLQIRNSFIDSQIVDCYAKKGLVSEAKTIFYNMLTNGLDVKSYAFTSLVKAMLDDGDAAGEVVGMLTQYGRQFSELDKSFWPQVVSAFLTSKKESYKQDLLKHILEVAVPLQPQTYVALLNHFTSSKDVSSRALGDQLISELKQQGANGIGVLVMMYTEKNDVGSAMALWKEVKEKARILTPNTFTHLLTVCAACGYLEDVEDIYGKMKELRIEPSTAALAAMVRLYASNLRIDEAKKFFQTLLSQPTYISPFLFNSMLDMFADVGDAEAALNIVKQMEDRHMKPNVSIFNSLIALHLKSLQPALALQTYKQMVQEKMPVNFNTYKTLLGASQELLPKSTLDRQALLKEATASNAISHIGKTILKQILENSSKSL